MVQSRAHFRKCVHLGPRVLASLLNHLPQHLVLHFRRKCREHVTLDVDLVEVRVLSLKRIEEDIASSDATDVMVGIIITLY